MYLLGKKGYGGGGLLLGQLQLFATADDIVAHIIKPFKVPPTKSLVFRPYMARRIIEFNEPGELGKTVNAKRLAEISPIFAALPEK